MINLTASYIQMQKISALAEEAMYTESKGCHFAKLKQFSTVKITFLWRDLTLRGVMALKVELSFKYFTSNVSC